MKRVDLNMKEKTIYEIIKKLVDTNGNKKRASIRLGCTERFNQTFKKRLPQELRTANIKTIEEANNFLNTYINKFNKRFSIYKNNISSVFEKQPSSEKINLTLAILATRKFDSGSSIKYNNKYYQAVSANETTIYNFKKGTEGLAIKTFDNRLFITVEEKIYLLKELDTHQLNSKDFDEPIEHKKKPNKYIPPMTHPWKRKSFEQFLAKQKHRFDHNQNGANV